MQLDLIGHLHDIDDSNPEYPAVTLLPGWHVNSPTIIDGLDAYRIEPEKKRFVFSGAESGVPTYCYRFENKNEALELLGLHEVDVP